MLTISSRAFNQDAGRAKKAAANGPVIITDRGKPAHVLLTYETYLELTGRMPSIADLMYMPGVAEIELDIPPRARDRSREADFS